MASEPFEIIDMEEVQSYVEQNGVLGIDEFLKTKLNEWKDVEINIGVTGNAGAGKSSFINAIRGLDDDDPLAAETGITETTLEPECFRHPTSLNIYFWDLPGIGTPKFPVETYCEKVGMEKFDTFLILAANRFSENDKILAEKVKSMEKSFFFIRTKIDQDYENEKRRKSFNEQAMLEKIKKDCLKNLQHLAVGDEDVFKDVFLISNHHQSKWDFARLTGAILDVLPSRQKEALTLTLSVLTSLSTDILKRKVEILRARIWKVASASAAGAVVPLPGLSVAVDLVLIMNEVNFYRAQLGLPKEDSDEFKRMTPEIQKKVRNFCITSAAHLASLLAIYATSATVEEFVRFIPILGSAIAGGISFSSTYYFLHNCLDDMEKTALDFVQDMASKTMDDFDID